MEGKAFGGLAEGQPQTTTVEGLVIPARLDTVQATNFVLTQQVGTVQALQSLFVFCFFLIFLSPFPETLKFEAFKVLIRKSTCKHART